MAAACHFPVCRSFYYDAHEDQWLEYDGRAQDIDPLADVALIFPAKSYQPKDKDWEMLLWCPVHQRYEPWDDASGRCQPKAPHCFFTAPPNAAAVLPTTSLWRWRIVQDSPEADLQIIADWLQVRWEKKFLWQRWRSELVPCCKNSEACYRINLLTKKEQGTFEYDLHRSSAFPTPIARGLYEIIAASMSRLYQKQILIPPFLKESSMDIIDLQRIAAHPQDVHIAYLEYFLGQAFSPERFPPVVIN